MEKRIKRMISGILIALLFCGSWSAAETFAASGTGTELSGAGARTSASQKIAPLKVKGTQIVNAKTGKTVRLKGLSTHGLAWYPQYVKKKTFKALKADFHINTIRLAMYTAENGGYCVSGRAQKKKLKNRIAQGVKYAEELKMYAIIDWHILSDGNPNKYVKQATAFFTEMAKTYRKKNHVIYEICNEPNHTSWKQVKKYAQKVIPAIRKYDKDALIIVGTPTWSQDADKIAKLKYSNVLYAMHFYAGTHKQDLRDKLSRALQRKVPVFVSEFGMCDASGNGAINKKETEKWLRLLDKKKIGYVAWNISNKQESAAILKSSCRKTSGFKNSDYSPAGKWLISRFSGRKNTASAAKTKSTAAKTAAKAKVTAKCSNKWQEGGRQMSQWSVSVKNGNKARTSWTLKLTFNQVVSVRDHWNFQYKRSKNGKTLTLTPKRYNKKLKAKGKLTDLGMILRSGKGLKVTGASFS